MAWTFQRKRIVNPPNKIPRRPSIGVPPQQPKRWKLQVTLTELSPIQIQRFVALEYPNSGFYCLKMLQYMIRRGKRASQGDIYKDIAIIEARDPDNASKLIKTSYGYVIVLSQECDLARDWDNYRELEAGSADGKHDKLLRHVILAPCYPFERFLEGDHIHARRMNIWKKKEFQEQIRQNNHKRFHFLAKQDGINLPNLVVDFKHYFTLERDVFYRLKAKPGKYVCSLDKLYREEFSRRFAAYQARIGLPEEVQRPRTLS